MSERILAPRATPSAEERAGLFQAGPSLPPEILRDAPKRLGAVSLTYAITYVTTFFVPLTVAALSDIEMAAGAGAGDRRGHLDRRVAGDLWLLA